MSRTRARLDCLSFVLMLGLALSCALAPTQAFLSLRDAPVPLQWFCYTPEMFFYGGADSDVEQEPVPTGMWCEVLFPLPLIPIHPQFTAPEKKEVRL